MQIKKYRLRNKLTQNELGKKVGATQSSVTDWEKGRCYPTMDKLIIMCKIFKCTINDLIKEE